MLDLSFPLPHDLTNLCQVDLRPTVLTLSTSDFVSDIPVTESFACIIERIVHAYHSSTAAKDLLSFSFRYLSLLFVVFVTTRLINHEKLIIFPLVQNSCLGSFSCLCLPFSWGLSVGLGIPHCRYYFFSIGSPDFAGQS